MTGPCPLCSRLPSGVWHDDVGAPEGFGRLVPAAPPSATQQEALRRCPACRTYFAHRVDDDVALGGVPRLIHRLRRLHPLEAFGRLDGEERIVLESRLADILADTERDLRALDEELKIDAARGLAAMVDRGDARAIAVGRRNVARGGEALLAALMRRDRPWALAHFAEAVRPTGLADGSLPNVVDWPRQDLADLLRAHGICLTGTARGGSVTQGRTVFYADELFFHVRLSPHSKDAPQPMEDLRWFDKVEFADWVAREYDERVSTEVIGRYSDVPPFVLAEAPRRARRVDVALGLLFDGSRWLPLGSPAERLRHSYGAGWHVVVMSAEAVASVATVAVAEARSRVLEQLGDAADLETQPTPPGVAAAVDAILGRAAP